MRLLISARQNISTSTLSHIHRQRNPLLHAPIHRRASCTTNFDFAFGLTFTKRASSTMTTITLKSPAISVSLPAGFSEEQLLSFSPFHNWLQTLTKSLSLQHANPKHPFHEDPYALRSITVQSYDLFGAKRVGFLKLRADVTNSAGEALPGAVFLRGPSVGMLMMLIPDDTAAATAAARPQSTGLHDEERYVVLTVQPRIPAGSLAFPELPAGMVDDDDDGGGAAGESGEGKFAGTAAREIHEELGIEIPASELVCLSDLAADDNGGAAARGDEEEGLPSAMYPSAGGCDEYIPIYMHERRVPRDTLKEWTGKLTGLRDHGEKITLKLVPMRDLWREGRRDAKALAALALWEGLKREGKLQ